jgi:hypothetical protein
MLKYRRSHQGQPGVRFRHWGSADDELDTTRTYGHKTGMKMEGSGVLDAREETRVAEFLRHRQEAIYETSKLEPLGKAFQRYELPEGKRDGLHGKSSEHSEAAVTLVFPRDNKFLSGEFDDDPHYRALYIKSHQSWKPGEQKTRSYNFHGIDPVAHRFGIKDKEGYTEGVKKALNPAEEFESGVKPTKIINKRVDDHRWVRSDQLGKPKNLGLGTQLDETHTFGIRSQPAEDWDASMCTSGTYTLEEQLPDKDLGRTILRGCAPEHVVSADSTRIFGVPSIRDDIAEPRKRSVADSQNYGNEPSAKELLYPAPFADRGVNETDFLCQRSKADLRDLMLSSGAISSDETFDVVWSELEASVGETISSISVDRFRRKMIELSLSGRIQE